MVDIYQRKDVFYYEKNRRTSFVVVHDPYCRYSIDLLR